MRKRGQTSIIFNIVVGIILTALIFLMFYLVLWKIDSAKTSEIFDVQYVDVIDSYIPMLMIADKQSYTDYLRVVKTMDKNSVLFGDLKNYETHNGEITQESVKNSKIKYCYVSYYYEHNKIKTYLPALIHPHFETGAGLTDFSEIIITHFMEHYNE